MLSVISHMSSCRLLMVFFFFNDTATTEIYTLSLHDALPISRTRRDGRRAIRTAAWTKAINRCASARGTPDRKSTRLNSSHVRISYAVFCLEKKKECRHVLGRRAVSGHLAGELD